MAKIKWEGLDKLQKKLKENVTMNDVKRVVRKNGAELQERMMKKAEFKEGYQTGETKGSISLEIRDGGFTAGVGPTTDYSPYLEYGTRFMSARPTLGPAFTYQSMQFIDDLKHLME